MFNKFLLIVCEGFLVKYNFITFLALNTMLPSVVYDFNNHNAHNKGFWIKWAQRSPFVIFMK